MTEKEATEKAETLSKRLGEGWQPHVWYNLHWCYSARKGGVSIHESGIPGQSLFSAYFNPHSIVVGHSNVSPNLALVDLQTSFKACYERQKNYWEVLAQVKAEI